MLNPDAFLDTLTMRHLDISGNLLKSIPSEALSHLIHLKSLRIRNSQLEVIPAFAFRGLSLQLLDLGGNRLPLQIDSRAFCGLHPKVAYSTNKVR